MSVDHAVDTVSKILKYMRELIEKIFESETSYKVVGRVGDYLAYELPGGEFAAVDITADVTPESRFTRVTTTPTFKTRGEINIYITNLMIDKYIQMKREMERELGMHQYGSPYM